MIVALLTLAVVFPVAPDAVAANGVVAVTTLGTRPQLVSDGDALLAVQVTATVLDGTLRVSVTGPDGVYDYSKPGVSQQGAVPWLTYAAGPGGLPVA